MLLSMHAPKVKGQCLKETYLSNNCVRVGTVDG